MKWSESGFGQRLDARLAELGKTQKSFAAEIKIPANTLSGWKETNEPSYEDIIVLAEALGVRPAWLAFGDSFEPMDDEESELATAWRTLAEDERAGFLAAFRAVSKNRQPIKKPGTRTRKPQLQMEINHDLGIVAFTPASGAGERGESQPQSSTPPLSLEESEALLKWFGTNLKSMPLERPLTKALRKIATMLNRGVVPAELPPDLALGATSPASREKAAPSAKAPKQRHRHPSSSP